MKVLFVTQDGLSTLNFCRQFAREIGGGGAVEFVTMSSVDAYERELRELGIRHIDLAPSRFWNPIRDLSYLARLFRLLRKERFDVVVTFGTKPNLLAAPVARLAGVGKVVVAVRGLGRAFAPRPGPSAAALAFAASTLYRIACAAAHRVWFTNPADRAFFVDRRLVDEGRCFLTRNSVNLDVFSSEKVCERDLKALRRELEIAPDAFVVIMVARLIWLKGIREYVEAARTLARRHSDIRFILLAAVERRTPGAVPEAFVRRAEDELPLTWLEFRKDVREFYALSDVAVLPSFYKEGGYPRALLEPMALGKPVIAADTADCRAPVEEEGNGFLVAPGDAEALAERIEQLYLDPDMRERFGRRSRELVEARYDDRMVVEQVLREVGLVATGDGEAGGANGRRWTRAGDRDERGSG